MMVKVALRNNFAATGRAMNRAVATSLARAGEQTADWFGRTGQQKIRQRMVSTGLGRMQGAIRFTSSLKRRRGANRRPVAAGTAFATARLGWAVIWNANSGDRSTGAFDAYSARDTTVIKPKSGKRWLAFPTDSAPKRVGRNKITPALYNKSGLARSIGPLFFLKGPSANVAYLAVKDVSVTAKTGGKVRALGKRGGVGKGRVKKDLIIMFILIRATTRNRRVNPSALLEVQMGQAFTKFGFYLAAFQRSVVPATQPVFSAGGSASGQFTPVLRA